MSERIPEPPTDPQAARVRAYGLFLTGLIGQDPDDLDELLSMFGADPQLVAQARADDERVMRGGAIDDDEVSR